MKHTCSTDWCEACIMNVITHDTAYSIYARATFIKQRSLVYNRRRRSPEALVKYEQCGWLQLPYLEATDYDNSSSSFARGTHHLGDRKCWTIQLLLTLALCQGYMDSHTWNLHYFGRGGPSDWRIFPTHNWMLLKEKQLFKNVYLTDRVRGFATNRFIHAFQKGRLYCTV